MDNFNITFLGTGNAVPTKKRNHTSILVSFLNENILIDCGEGTQRQLKLAEISPHKITKLLITHWHGDHTLGIPGLFQTLAMSKYTKILEVYGPVGTKKNIDLIQKIYHDFKIKIKVNEISNHIINNSTFTIQSLPMQHNTPTNAYSITLKDKRRIYKNKLKKLKIPNSSLIKDLQLGRDIIFNNKKIKCKNLTYIEKGKKISIVLDTKMNPNIQKISKNSDLLIIESSFANEEKEKAEEYFHLTAKQSAEIAKKSKIKALILTHLSERYEHNPSIIEKEAKKVFKKTKLVNDLDKLII